MKKLLSVMLLLSISISLFAQKSYVTVICNMFKSGGGSTVFAYLSGNLPSGIKSEYAYNDINAMKDSSLGGYYYARENVGTVLNLLANEGFVVENMTSTSNSVTDNLTMFLLSKSSSNISNSKVINVIVDKDPSDIYEVARYNLQGAPVEESEKGIQIIVYSNYTTKTVIVE